LGFRAMEYAANAIHVELYLVAGRIKKTVDFPLIIIK
jgi:hypothetical protein